MKKPRCERQVDSGWSWVIAGACCFANCMLYGVSRLAGMLLHPAVETYGVSRGAAAVPFSTSSAVRNLSGPVVGILGQHFGIRPIAATGCILASLGAGLCFFTSDVFWTTICWGGIFGIGFGLSTSLLPSAINQNFKKHKATASGISYSGSYIGSFIFPPLVMIFLDNYGLPGTFLFLSGFILQSLAAVALLKPTFVPNTESQTVYTISKDKKPANHSSIPEYDSHDANLCYYSVTDEHNTKNSESEHSTDRSVIKELFQLGTVPISNTNETISDKSYHWDHVLDFIAVIQNCKSPNHFLDRNMNNMPDIRAEQYNLSHNMLFEDLTSKVYEYVISNQNQNCGFPGEKSEVNTLRIQSDKTLQDSYFLLRPADNTTEAFMSKLQDSDNLSFGKNLPNRGVVLWGVFQECPFIPETESSIRLQKFTKWKRLTGRDLRRALMNVMTSDKEKTATSGNQNSKMSSERRIRKPNIFSSCSVPTLARLAQSFKEKTTTTRANHPIHKALSDSNDIRASPCFTAMRKCNKNQSKSSHIDSFVIGIHLASSKPPDVIKNPNNKGRSRVQIPCRYTSQKTSSYQVHQKHVENDLSDPSIFQTPAIISEEKSAKNFDATAPLEINRVAVFLIRRGQNFEPKDAFGNSTKCYCESKIISCLTPDLNQNFIDSANENSNNRTTETSDFSAVEIGEKAQESNSSLKKARHVIVWTRLRSWCSVFTNPMFLLISVTMAIYSFVMVCIITVIEDYARDMEQPNTPKPYVLMILSVADLCGTLGLGWIIDRGFLTKRAFIVVCFCGMAISAMLMAFATQIISLYIFVATYGLFESGVVITFPLLTAQFIRADKETIATASSSLLSAPAILLVPFVIGYFRDHLGSYHKLFCLLSVTSCACGFLWIIIPYILQKYTLKFKNRFS